MRSQVLSRAAQLNWCERAVPHVPVDTHDVCETYQTSSLKLQLELQLVFQHCRMQSAVSKTLPNTSLPCLKRGEWRIQQITSVFLNIRALK